MIFYLFLKMTDPIYYTNNNPFLQFEYPIGASIIVELILLFYALWMSRIIGYRIGLVGKKRHIFIPVVFAMMYPIAWACCWISEPLIAAGLAILIIGTLSVIALAIIDKYCKYKRN